jgi:hypothetical protein
MKPETLFIVGSWIVALLVAVNIKPDHCLWLTIGFVAGYVYAIVLFAFGEMRRQGWLR